MCYAKVLLFGYNQMDKIIDRMNDSIKRKCLDSFSLCEPCFNTANRVIKLIDNRDKLIELKRRLDIVFNHLSEEEKVLIGYKYFKNKAIEGFDYKSRKYFRKQVRALEHFKVLLGYINITEDFYNKEYKNIPYFKTIEARESNDKLDKVGKEFAKEFYA